MINNIKKIIRTAIITLIGQDNELYNRAQVEYLETPRTIHILMPYGLYAVLPKDSLVLTFAVNGNEDNLIGIGEHSDTRFKDLKEGEVIVGNAKTQSKIYFKENGDVLIESQGNININSTGVVNINGDTQPIVRGTALQTLFNSHQHTSAGSGSPSSTPIQQMSATELSTKNFTE